jgi:membrane-associated PAP2 superfamily phosphatase
MKKLYFWLCVILPVVLALLFGAVMGLMMDGEYLESWLTCSGAMYLFCLAPIHVGAIIHYTTKMDEGHSIVFGCGLYYGMIICAGIIGKDTIPDSFLRYLIAFVISALVCYIVWLKIQKKESNK